MYESVLIEEWQDLKREKNNVLIIRISFSNMNEPNFFIH